jgi:hypothetical protein
LFPEKEEVPSSLATIETTSGNTEEDVKESPKVEIKQNPYAGIPQIVSEVAPTEVKHEIVAPVL